MDQPLYIPIILGATRQGRMSEHAARFVGDEVQKRDGTGVSLPATSALEASLAS